MTLSARVTGLFLGLCAVVGCGASEQSTEPVDSIQQGIHNNGYCEVSPSTGKLTGRCYLPGVSGQYSDQVGSYQVQGCVAGVTPMYVYDNYATDCDSAWLLSHSPFAADYPCYMPPEC